MNSTQCPYCHQSVALIPVGFAHQPDRYPVSLESAVASPLALSPAAAPGEYQKITPIARLEPKDITTALYDSSVSFVLVSLAGGAAVWALGWPWVVAPAIGLAAAVWRYFGGLSLARSLLEVVETITQKDIDHDGKAGKKQEHVVRVEMKDRGKWQFANLPGEPAALISLAQAITADGDTFSERTATDAGLTQEQFSDLRDIFVDRGWAVWNHPTRRQQGVTLTLSGKAVLRSIAASPLPQDEIS